MNIPGPPPTCATWLALGLVWALVSVVFLVRAMASGTSQTAAWIAAVSLVGATLAAAYCSVRLA